MRFYKKQHKYYCGIDLHTRVMYVCITDEKRKYSRTLGTLKLTPRHLSILSNNTEKISAVAVECVFVWYWLADLCQQLELTFVLGHALYMKAIHGGKVKNDKIDSKKIADLLRSGLLPIAYAYPKKFKASS